jgi:hypothetical protein
MALEVFGLSNFSQKLAFDLVFNPIVMSSSKLKIALFKVSSNHKLFSIVF